MEINLQLVLPRDEQSVPLVRHISGFALREVEVLAECRDDIELALSEACTNVLAHAGPGDSYEVHVGIDEAVCAIRVIDAGHGFDYETLSRDGADETAEGGRGIDLMHALVDRVHFESRKESGTVVLLEKRLQYAEGASARPAG
jgi:serine/threonine-protein kinase RsbW